MAGLPRGSARGCGRRASTTGDPVSCCPARSWIMRCRADLLPAFDTEISEVPSATNPLGMRGGSEGGITPGLAAVANAIVDALAEFGVEHIELPVTPERVWKAARATRDRTECHRPITA